MQTKFAAQQDKEAAEFVAKQEAMERMKTQAAAKIEALKLLELEENKAKAKGKIVATKQPSINEETKGSEPMASFSGDYCNSH